jgi:hypothetical protein
VIKIRLRSHISPTLLALGGGIVAIAGVILGFIYPLVGSELFHRPEGRVLFVSAAFFVVGMLVFVTGMIIFLAGCFQIVRTFRIISEWNDELLKQVLRSAPPLSTIRVLQTWLPDKEHFCSFLEELLIKRGKQFRFEILLMNPEAQALIAARLKHRTEGPRPDYGVQAILDSKERLIKMKERVDTEWSKKYLGAKLDLNIRYYDFMPFGPIYQIKHDNQRYLFVGFYINFDSSVRGPMLFVRDAKSRIWEVFEDDFATGWGGGDTVIGD